MRLDRPPTLPELVPEFRAYPGQALRPFLETRQLTPETLAECVEVAVARRDQEGTRLARILVGLPKPKREALRRALSAPGLKLRRRRTPAEKT